MKKGELWIVDLIDSKGHVQRGIRPGVVAGSSKTISSIIPLTTNLNMLRFPHTYAITPDAENQLNAASVALVYQITAVDDVRISKKIGKLSATDQAAIDALLKAYLQL